MKLYAFDVDHTLEISSGPVRVTDMVFLHATGHIVGICGNYAVAVARIPNWRYFVNFLGPMEMTKAAFLTQLKSYVGADEYIMVGNDHRDTVKWPNGVSQDGVAAEEAGFRFISEDDFAAGGR